MTLPQTRQRPGGTGRWDRRNILSADDSTADACEAQRRADDEREARIDCLRLEFLAAVTTDERHSLWNRMKSEIGARSLEQVRRIEQERGLYSVGARA